MALRVAVIRSPLPLLAAIVPVVLASAFTTAGGRPAGPTVATELRFQESQRLEVAGREDLTRNLDVLVRIVGDSVREDRDDRVSFLLRPQLGTLVRLDHELGIYQEYSTPVRIEEILEADGLLRAFRTMQGEEELTRVTEADAAGSDEGGRRLTLVGTVGRKGYTVDSWLTPRDDVPTAAYLRLLRNVEALSTASRLWSARLAGEESFPSRLRVRFGEEGYRRSRDRRLVGVRRERLEPEAVERLFEVPGDYRRMPAYCLPDFTVGSDPACRVVAHMD